MKEPVNKNSADTVRLDPARWVEVHGDYLYNYAYSRVRSKELAEDLVQDTFIAGLKAGKSFKGKSSEITWLISILKRKVIDHYRKMSTRNEMVSSEFASPFHKEGSDDEGHWILDRAPKHWESELDDPVNRKEFRKILDECLANLPRKWQAVFVLRMVDGINSEKVCKELGCTSSNLWVMLHRARLKLRECIEIKWLK